MFDYCFCKFNIYQDMESLYSHVECMSIDIFIMNFNISYNFVHFN